MKIFRWELVLLPMYHSKTKKIEAKLRTGF
jgi:hypothetical protein